LDCPQVEGMHRYDDPKGYCEESTEVETEDYSSSMPSFETPDHSFNGHGKDRDMTRWC
jgi:hypothetical protein